MENIFSDRKLIEVCSDSLAIRLFLVFDLDEHLPWHSTISLTRPLYDAELFEEVFLKILSKCIDSGLVAGHTQGIDSAFVKANASMDTLELKVPEEDLDDHFGKVRQISQMDNQNPHRKTQNNKATTEHRTIIASDSKLNDIQTRQKKWAQDQDQRPGAGNKGSKYTSNHTHYSPTDPDAKIHLFEQEPKKQAEFHHRL